MKTPESMDQYLRMTDEQKMQLLGVSTQPTTPKVFGIHVPPRDCKHGQLARSCNICDLERELAAMTAERDEARRQIEALCGQLHNLRGPRTNWWEKQHWREWSLAEARKGRG
jgi:hypothetical protein